MRRHDAIVVGAGPAGSIAALVLARAGATVALVDRREFPREKACGDLIGPRGVRLLDELGITVPGSRSVGDMIVVAPNGRRTLLPALPGRDFAEHGSTVPREQFDTRLFDMAVAAGATPVRRPVTGLEYQRDVVAGVKLAGGAVIHADVVLGADGATSTVARAAGLVEPSRVRWGFALRGYLDGQLELPHIMLWEPRPWQLFPGYGWAFPMAGGGVNIGLGLALGADRAASRRAGELLDEFLAHLARQHLLCAAASPGGARSPGGMRSPGGARSPGSGSAGPGLPSGAALRDRIGGWLKLGVVGTSPTAPGLLLIGDAAGLVNPLQGEGIAQAMASGRAAAQAILAAGPRDAAGRYRGYLRGATAHHRSNAPLHDAMVRHPLAVSTTARVLSAPGVNRLVAGAWGLYWNDLAPDALPSRHRGLALTALRAVTAAGQRGDTAHWFDTQFPADHY